MTMTSGSSAMSCLEREWGYFVLSELQSTRGPMGLAVERDLYFEPKLFSKIDQK